MKTITSTLASKLNKSWIVQTIRWQTLVIGFLICASAMFASKAQAYTVSRYTWTGTITSYVKDASFTGAGTGNGFVDVDMYAVNISTVGAVTYDNSHSQFRYIPSNGWAQQSGISGTYNNTQSLADVTGSFFRFAFDGSQVTYLFSRAANRGIAAITIDGNDLGTIDMWSSTTVRQQSLTWGNLGSGTHVLNVLVTGNKNSQSTGTFVDVDALIVQKEIIEDFLFNFDIKYYKQA